MNLSSNAAINPKNSSSKRLTKRDQARNRTIAQVRIRVEHALSGVKRSRCVKDTLRNARPEGSDQFIANASGLHNLRVKHRKRPLRR